MKQDVRLDTIVRLYFYMVGAVVMAYIAGGLFTQRDPADADAEPDFSAVS